MEITINSVQVFLDSIFQIFSLENRDIFTEDLNIYYENLEEDISPLLKSDLSFFFEKTSLGQIFSYNSFLDHSSVLGYIDNFNKLADMSKKDLIELLLFKDNHFSRDRKDDLDAVFDEIQRYHDSLGNKLDAKKGLLELNSYPTETILRIKTTLERYYKTHYKKIENEILEKLEIEREKILKLYPDSDPLADEAGKIGVENRDLTKMTTNNLITYFPYAMLSMSVSIGNSHITNIFHYRYLDKLDPVKMLEKSTEFIKIISDDTRMKIIKLLATKKCYSTEIANELGLNKGTVSYHMEKLKKEDVIKFNFEKRRIYYSLRKDRLKEMFDSFIAGIEHLTVKSP